MMVVDVASFAVGRVLLAVMLNVLMNVLHRQSRVCVS